MGWNPGATLLSAVCQCRALLPVDPGLPVRWSVMIGLLYAQQRNLTYIVPPDQGGALGLGSFIRRYSPAFPSKKT